LCARFRLAGFGTPAGQEKESVPSNLSHRPVYAGRNLTLPRATLAARSKSPCPVAPDVWYSIPRDSLILAFAGRGVKAAVPPRAGLDLKGPHAAPAARPGLPAPGRAIRARGVCASSSPRSPRVIPAQAGLQRPVASWIRTFAGMTGERERRERGTVCVCASGESACLAMVSMACHSERAVRQAKNLLAGCMERTGIHTGAPILRNEL
jgi:hypothetical protein